MRRRAYRVQFTEEHFDPRGVRAVRIRVAASPAIRTFAFVEGFSNVYPRPMDPQRQGDIIRRGRIHQLFDFLIAKIAQTLVFKVPQVVFPEVEFDPFVRGIIHLVLIYGVYDYLFSWRHICQVYAGYHQHSCGALRERVSLFEDDHPRQYRNERRETRKR